MSDKMTVLIIDSCPMWCIGVAAVINRQPDMQLVAQASTGDEAIQYFRKHQTDVILMDARLPDISTVDFIISVQVEFPSTRFIIISSFAHDSEIRRTLAHGAYAYLLKSMPSSEVVKVIRHAHAGKRTIPALIAAQLAEHYNDELLSNREVEVLRQLLDGNRNRDIAEKLFIAEDTVKAHMKNIMGKLGASDRTQAVAIAIRRGLIYL